MYIWDRSEPWSEEEIISSYFFDFTRTYETINQSQSGRLVNELNSLRLSLDIFLDSVSDLLGSINEFKGGTDRPSFWDEANNGELERIVLKVQRGIFCSCASALALVDHTRSFATRYPINKYQSKVNEYFVNDGLHQFVHSFRRYISHVRITKANWKITTNKYGKSVFFILRKEELDRWRDWSSLAKTYISSCDEGVNIEQLFDDYSKKVKQFHDWLRSMVWGEYSEDVHEYYSNLKVLKSQGSKSNWNIAITQIFGPSDIDPYMYLDKYLNKRQLEQVLALPYRSKEQVDKIVVYIDVYGICDDNIREKVYQLFKVAP